MKRRALLLIAALPAWAQQAVEANSATRAELESLPGLGPALVQRLLAARPFKDWAELMHRVPGVKTAAALKLSAAGLRVAGEPFSAVGRETG
jgi:competence protein ComEA